MNRIRKFFRLSSQDRRLFMEAAFISLKVKCMISCFPLRWYVGSFGVQHAVTPENNEEDDPLLKNIARAILRSGKVLSFSNSCLVNAITAKKMLSKRGFKSTLYFGVGKEKEKDREMTAHAWLRCGTFIVTGKQGMQKFVVVNTFS